MSNAFNKQAIYDEMERARTTFSELVKNLSGDDLQRQTNGTRWTNKQMLFHMLFGYILVVTLVRLVKIISALPKRVQHLFAAALNAVNRPFHSVNYFGSVIGGSILSTRMMRWLFNRVTARLVRRLATESESSLTRGMSYPTKWDPFFNEYMTLGDVYRYPTQHFDFHRRQLSVK